LKPSEVAAAAESGALVLDVHPPLTFAHGHIAGSVNLQFNTADLADRAEMALPEGVTLVVVAASDAVAGAAERILGDAGFKVEGYLQGGLDAWKSAGRDVVSIPVLNVKELRDRFEQFQVIDARERFEYKYAHIPGAILLPSLAAWEGSEKLDHSRPFAVVCGDQVRSATVASMLRRAGADAYLVSGGMVDWLERDFPVEKAS
jgi:rhodanese-related sulfurtransferase